LSEILRHRIESAEIICFVVKQVRINEPDFGNEF